VLHSLTAYETNVWIRAEECPAGGQWREPNTSTYGVGWLDNDETMARSDAQVLLSKFCVASCRRCQQEAYAKSQPSHVALASTRCRRERTKSLANDGVLSKLFALAGEKQSI
jgi:hypothetical protein